MEEQLVSPAQEHVCSLGLLEGGVTTRQKGADPAHWKLLKQRWLEWKVCAVVPVSHSLFADWDLAQKIAKHYHHDTHDAFWKTFTNLNGARMDWTAILGAIRHENADGDRRLAEQA